MAGGAYGSIAKELFPSAEILDSAALEPLINHEVDCCIWSRTSGLVWCYSHPEFIAMDYGASLGKTYLGYPIPATSVNLDSFLNNWLKIKEESGFKQEMLNYWIIGQVPEKKTPRWSILRDLLHFID